MWPTVVAPIWETNRVKRFLPVVVHATPVMVTVLVAVPANASVSLVILQHVTANNGCQLSDSVRTVSSRSGRYAILLVRT